MFIPLIFITLLLLYILYYKKNIGNIYGPKKLPLLGNSLLFVNGRHRILNILHDLYRKYPKFMVAEAFPFFKHILVSDYHTVEALLSSTQTINKSNEYKIGLKKWLGTGLLTSDGPKWKKHRRLLSPAFHFNILNEFLGVFDTCGTVLCKKLEQEIDNLDFDVYPYVSLCTLDIICESVMGVSIEAQINRNSEYIRSVKIMCEVMFEKISDPIERFPFLYPLTRNYYREGTAVKVLHKVSNDVIRKRRKALDGLNVKKTTSTSENVYIKNKKAFLDLLLQAQVDGRSLTDDEIREEVDTFLFEGHDTTASALSFALFCLANHADVQNKVYGEQIMLFGEEQTPKPTYTDFKNMKYLEQVIKETLRLYPPVPIIGRSSSKHSVNAVMKGAHTIGIFIFGVHRDPQYFQNPDKFDPSRFERNDEMLPYAYIPFSAGPRNCIGQKFAMLELKSTISKIIRKYELLPSIPHHEPQLVVYATLKSANGIRLRIKLRK